MRRKNSAIFFVNFVFIVLLSGCASRGPVTLSPEVARQIKTADVCIVLSQQEIYAEIEKSEVTKYTGGGLIPALIDVAVNNHRTKKSEDTVLPIRESMAGYDFQKSLEYAIRQRLFKNNTLKIEKLTVTNDSTKERFKQEVSNSSAQSVLFIKCKYYLSPDFNSINISAENKLLPKAGTSGSANEPGNALYENKVFYQKFKDYQDSKADGVNYWSNNNASFTRQALDEGVKEIANKIASDLNIDETSASVSSIEKVQ